MSVGLVNPKMSPPGTSGVPFGGSTLAQRSATFARLLVSLLEGALLLSRLEAHQASLGAAREWIRKST